MDNRDQLIIIIVSSVLACLLVIFCFLLAICLFLRQRKFSSLKRLNTMNSSISSSFDPPHLINKNVKHLDQLLASESTLTAKSWQFKENELRHANNAMVYTTDSSTMSTSMSDLAVALHSYQPFNHSHSTFLAQLDQVLHSPQHQPFNNCFPQYSHSSTNSEHEHDDLNPHPMTPHAAVEHRTLWMDDSAILY